MAVVRALLSKGASVDTKTKVRIHCSPSVRFIFSTPHGQIQEFFVGCGEGEGGGGVQVLTQKTHHFFSFSTPQPKYA